jgi:hypothetical protein
VSTIRQGVTPMNGRGFVASPSVRIREVPGLEEDDGTLQFATAAPICACRYPDGKVSTATADTTRTRRDLIARSFRTA